MRLSEVLDPQTSDRPPSYREDNPGGRWLREKQADAEYWAKHSKSDEARRMLGGTQTAWAYDVLLPTKWLSTLEGALGEQRRPGDVKYDNLQRSVSANGWQQIHHIMVMVNHRGVPYAWEGNTRIAVALANGIPAVRAEIRWLNGAEQVNGPASPSRVARMHREAIAASHDGSPHPRDDPDADMWKEGWCHALALALRERRAFPLVALKVKKGRSIIIAHVMSVVHGEPTDERATFLDIEGVRHLPEILLDTEHNPDTDEMWVEPVTADMIRKSPRLTKITPEIAARAQQVARRLLDAEGI